MARNVALAGLSFLLFLQIGFSSTDPIASFCTGRPDGLYPNPSNSATFFQCSNGNTYIQPCPAGLVYNDACKCCNWPNEAVVGGNSPGELCQFPFKFKGNMYDSCTSEDSSQLWCATTSDFDRDEKWGYCPNKEAVVGGNSPGELCQFPFKFKGNMYDSCTSEDSSQLWCATTSDFDRDEKWGYCPNKDAVIGGNSPGELCQFPFKFQGNMYDSCTSESSSSSELWCATTSDYDRDEKWGYCPNQGSPVQSNSKPGPTDPDASFCTGRPDGLHPNPSNSATFFQCSHGITHIQPCPADLVYDDACKCCNWPNGPTDPNASFCTSRPDGLYPNPSNSATFFQCSNGNIYIQHCQQGLVYDDTCKCCNWP